MQKFGAYTQNERSITLIPVCTQAERQDMISLIQRLQQGKYKYEGSQRTFGAKLLYETIYMTGEHVEIEDECKRIVQQHPEWEEDREISRIFLVSTPQHLFASDDAQSPYYVFI